MIRLIASGTLFFQFLLLSNKSFSSNLEGQGLNWQPYGSSASGSLKKEIAKILDLKLKKHFPTFAGTSSIPVNNAQLPYAYGKGFDSEKKNLLQDRCVEFSQIEPVSSNPSSGQETSFEYHQISNSEEMRSALDVDVSASYGVGLYSASAAVNYAKNASFLSNRVYYYFKIKTINETQQIKDPSIGHNVIKYFNPDSMEKFYEKCGDSYIRSKTTGGEMLAIMSITSSNSQESETVKAKLGFKGFGAAVDASFSQNLSKISESSQVDFQMFVRGPSLDALPAVTAHDIPALIAFAKTWPGLVKTKGGSSWLTNVTLESYSNVSFDGEKFELGNKINQSVLKNLTLNRDSRQNILNQINEYRLNPQRFELNKDPNFEKNMLAFEASLFDQIEKINGLARNCINSGLCSLFTLQMPYGEIPSLKQYDWEKICASERKTAYRNDLIDRFTYLELQAANLVPDYTDRTRTEIKGFLNCKDSQPSYFKLKLY